MKKHLLIAALSIALVAGGLFGKQALASAYEWLQIFDVIGCDTSCPAGTIITLKRNVQTSANYYEHRAVWEAIVAGVTSTEPALSEYRFLLQCRASGYVNTSEWDACDFPAVAVTSSYMGGPIVATTTTVFLRATTVYDGCSPYSDINPSSGCGDVYVRSRVITP